MSVMYARNHIMSINIGPAHGGCGQAPERPAGPDGRAGRGSRLAAGCSVSVRSRLASAAERIEMLIRPVLTGRVTKYFDLGAGLPMLGGPIISG